MRKVVALFLFFVLTVVPFVVAAQDGITDGYSRYKVKDDFDLSVGFGAGTLFGAPYETLFAEPPCSTVSGKIKLVAALIPGDVIIPGCAITRDGVANQCPDYINPEMHSYIKLCYKVKCDKEVVPELILHDPFGTRVIKFKNRVVEFCTPALLPEQITTTTTSTTTTSTLP